MALKQLGDTKVANERFNNLIKYCDTHINDEIKIDYFAVSLPDFLVFDTDLNLQNKVHCLFMKAPGNLGLEKINEAKSALKEAQKLNPSHV